MIDLVVQTNEWEVARLQARIDQLEEMVDVYRKRYEQCEAAVVALAQLKSALDKL